MRFARAGAKPFARKPYLEDATPWEKLRPPSSDEENSNTEEESSSKFKDRDGVKRVSRAKKSKQNVFPIIEELDEEDSSTDYSSDGIDINGILKSTTFIDEEDENFSPDSNSLLRKGKITKNNSYTTKGNKIGQEERFKKKSNSPTFEDFAEEIEKRLNDAGHRIEDNNIEMEDSEVDENLEEEDESEEVEEEGSELEEIEDEDMSEEVSDELEEDDDDDVKAILDGEVDDDAEAILDGEVDEDDDDDVKGFLDDEAEEDDNDEIEQEESDEETELMGNVSRISNSSGSWMVTDAPTIKLKKKKGCRRCKQTTHKTKKCPLYPKSSDSSKKVCAVCLRDDHGKRNCPEKNKLRNKNKETKNVQNKKLEKRKGGSNKHDKETECFHCKSLNHDGKKCPKVWIKPGLEEETKCLNCDDVGHFSRDCTKIPCSYCKEVGHNSRDCTKKPCYHCKETGHNSRDCSNKSCYRCKQVGHDSRDCPDKHIDSRICYHCNEAGHISRDCSNRPCYKCHGTGHIAKHCEGNSTSINSRESVLQDYNQDKKVRLNKHRLTEDEAKDILEMKENMRKDGVDQEEIESAVKLVARRAEKKRFHERKKQAKLVCYACQQTGHRFADCPYVTSKEKICYTCGSTEHLARDCDKKGSSEKTQEYAGASCFKCQKFGHIARQCPEFGLVCQNCGERGHIKRHCPQYLQTKSGSRKRDFESTEETQDSTQNIHKKPKLVNF